jgi:type I restriction enzyme S subunit
MSTDEKKTQVPKLRFPEFREADEWVKGKLIDTTDRSIKWSFIGGPFGSNLKSSDYVENGVRIIQLQNIGDGEFFDDYRIFTTVRKADELLSNNIYPGEIIMSKMGDPVGRACLIPNLHDRYVMCSDGIRLVVDEKTHAKYFVYSLINSSQFRATVEKTATGSTRKRIGLDELKNLPMLLPAKGEQQKIADCLSSLDELIAAQARKVEALKTHKKGLMQQIFPREGEIQPRLRYPEFRSAGGWDIKPFQKLFTIGSGRDYKHLSGGGIPVYGSGGYMLSVDDFLYDGESVCIGRKGTINNPMFLTGKFWTVDTLFYTHSFQDCSPKFVYAIFQNIDWLKHNEAGGIPSLSKTIIEKIQTAVPGTAEQQKIADCLSSLDTLITTATQELDTLKSHKKGLMQKIFPSVEAVTA